MVKRSRGNVDDDPLTEQGFTGSPVCYSNPDAFSLRLYRVDWGERISAKSRFLSLWVSWKLNKHTAKPTGWTDPRVHQPWIDARLPETWTLGQACSRRPSCTLAIIPSDKYLWAILLEIGRWMFDGVHRYLQIFSCPLCTGQLQIRGKADRGLSRLWRDWFNVYIYWISRRRISIEGYAREIVG